MVKGFGKVAGFADYSVSPIGLVVSHISKAHVRFLTPIKRGAYLGFTLRNDEGRLVPVYLHRFVCEAFNGPCPEGMQCRHLDGDKMNNHPANLAWGTPKENNQDKLRHGTANLGERNPGAKLDAATVRAMRERRAETGRSFRLLGEEFGVSTMTAHRAVTGKCWSHL